MRVPKLNAIKSPLDNGQFFQQPMKFDPDLIHILILLQ